jgi:PAS domain S-box-containing protein
MNERFIRPSSVRSAKGPFIAFGLIGAGLLSIGRRNYPDLHTILDTGMFLFSGVLALVLWDMGMRLSSSFPRLLAISFGVTSLLEMVHALLTVEWSGILAPIAQAREVLRPATWPLAAYVLPMGVVTVLWLLPREIQRVSRLALFLVVLGVALFPVFYGLPRYTPPTWLGITRPLLILVPVLWLIIGIVSWRCRAENRILPSLVCVAPVLCLANVVMLYSRAPHDTQAMVAHLGKVCGYLSLLLSLMQMAASDMQELIRAERVLAQMNADLGRRVQERTRQLESANTSLTAEIAVRRQAEETVKEGHERMLAIFETALDGIITMDHEGRIAEFNPAAERIFGHRRDKVIGQPLADVIIPPALREQHRRGLAHYLATAEAAVLGRRIEVTGLRADGSAIDLELSINRMPGSGPPMFAGFLRDITERERARHALAASERHYRLIFEQSPLPKWIYDPETLRFLAVNEAAQAHYGYSADEFLSMTIRDIRPPEDVAALQHDVALALENRSTAGEWRHRKKDGTLIQAIVSAHDITMNGQRARLVVAQDITERKRAEMKLRAQVARLNLLHRITRATAERQDLRSIFQAVIRTLEDDLPLDFSCVFVYEPSNEKLKVICVGMKSAALALELAMPENAVVPIDENGLSRCVSGHLVYEPDIADVPFSFPQRLARGGLRSLVIAPLLVESAVFGVLVAARRAPRSFSSGECEFLKQLSEHVALAAHQAKLYGALQVAYDDLRQTQQTIMQQERLRALGQMASGIAHDINNAISPAALYAESLLEKESNLSARGRDQLGIIQYALEDVAQTVARMREFYRQREPQLTLLPIQPNRLVKQVLDLTRARWSDMPQQRGFVVRLALELQPDLPAILGVESEIREALINLVFNAIDAMPEGGTLTLRTRAVETKSPLPAATTWRRVHIEVADTGMGMNEDTRRRCLEPFFTTKGERGTGLGLAMVYGTVQRHGAEIEIESAPGQGTTMSLIFATPEVEPSVSEPGAGPIPLSRLRLLLVDDDPLLIKSLRDILESDGHVIVTANDGQSGIEAFRAAHAGQEPFAAVITDLGMPHVDGRRVASAVKEISPETPVIMLTGWGQRLIAEGEVPPYVDRVLSKPPRLRELREVLASCCKGRTV